MLKFKIDGIPYEINDFISINNYAKVFKVKDLFTDEYMAAKIVNIITGAPLEDLLDSEFDQIQYLAAYITQLFPTKESIKFIDRFEIDGIDYGFFPSWKELTFAEFIDMDTICNKKPEEILDFLHILAAIMYRPIIKEDNLHQFEIEKYNIDSVFKRSELFKNKLKIDVILGAQFFFIKFAEKYLNYTQTSLITNLSFWEKIKMIWMSWRIVYKLRSKKLSVGSSSSTELLKMILQNTNISTKKN